MEASACGAVPVVTDIPTFRLLTAARRARSGRPETPRRSRPRFPPVAARDLKIERARLADHFARALRWDAVGRRALEIYREMLNTRSTGEIVVKHGRRR